MTSRSKVLVVTSTVLAPPRVAVDNFYCYTTIQRLLVSRGERMPLPHPVPDDLVELIARRFRVLGEPMRIKLLDRLREGEASVNELSEALGASQQNVSKHLNVLRQAGIIGRRREGNFAYYSIV